MFYFQDNIESLNKNILIFEQKKDDIRCCGWWEICDNYMKYDNKIFKIFKEIIKKVGMDKGIFFGVNVLLVPIFWLFFHFGPYIFILQLLVLKPINAWYLSPYRHPTNKKRWRGWRHIKIIIKKSILALKNATSASKLKKKLLILTKWKKLKTKNHMNWDLSVSWTRTQTQI